MKDLSKLKKELLKLSTPSNEKKLARIFDIFLDADLPFEESLEKFEIEMTKYLDDIKLGMRS